jgi:alpha-galactosidase
MYEGVERTRVRTLAGRATFDVEERMSSTDQNPHRISWDSIELAPVLQIKEGIKRRTMPMEPVETGTRAIMAFENEWATLRGHWEDVQGFGSRLSLRLTNESSGSLRITRLTFPAKGGIHEYAASIRAADVCFFRNGYQGWSTARSYRRRDKPLRPWLQLVSRASSNLANLPSNTPGVLSSEMYTLITNRGTDDAFLVGQGPPFDQFFYVKLNLYDHSFRESHFEFTYDFGRKMIMPGESVELGSIHVATGRTHQLVHRYFLEIRNQSQPRVPKENVHGWCSWYYYYTKITPQIIRANIDALKRARDEQGARIDFIQIDDGYQRAVGDWLSLTPEFEGQMRRLADEIRGAGFNPGVWIAPFVAARKSELLTIHPEYALRDERGRPVIAGYNPFWPGRYYYGLDVTNPRFNEYIRRVIRTIVGEWGFPYLKCDFLFGACLRGGTHHDLSLSRAEVLKAGMRLIREEAEAATSEDVFLVGCGMPLSPGIGTVDAMRVGPDTGGYWVKRNMKLLRTGTMLGVRNSIRNSVVRGGMHGALWLNDPDCLMLRTEGTRLSAAQRRTQINAIALTGGMLLYSDDFSALSNDLIKEIGQIQAISSECFAGRLIPLDMMAQELPSIIYNTAGYLGLFAMHRRKSTVTVEIDYLFAQAAAVSEIWGLKGHGLPGTRLVEVWTGDTIDLTGDTLTVGPLGSYESRLYRVE